MNLTILYQDKDVLCINKPAGLVVNRAGSVKEPTVQDWFIQFLQAQAAEVAPEDWQKQIPDNFSNEFGDPLSVWQERQGIVHRLDKDTSGLLLLAKHPGSLLHLLAQFRERQTAKMYQALVHGAPSLASGQIDASLARHSHNRLKFTVDPTGRPASTRYRVVDIYDTLPPMLLEDLALRSKLPRKKVAQIYQGGLSLLDLEPKTGRTHQLRVHLAALKHPIVGDIVYAGKKRARLDSLWCQRQFLHARSLTFTHPRTGQPQTVVAELPTDLSKILLVLRAKAI